MEAHTTLSTEYTQNDARQHSPSILQSSNPFPATRLRAKTEIDLQREEKKENSDSHASSRFQPSPRTQLSLHDHVKEMLHPKTTHPQNPFTKRVSRTIPHRKRKSQRRNPLPKKGHRTREEKAKEPLLSVARLYAHHRPVQGNDGWMDG